jgi:hypothetical protein
MDVQLSARLGAAALLLAVAGCGGSAASSAPPPFALTCDSADTAQQSALFCVRTDTRDGDVMVVDLDRLPITAGAARAGAEASGTYQTVCDSTSTPAQADFRCVRLHRVSGELVLLRLSELPHWPR